MPNITPDGPIDGNGMIGMVENQSEQGFDMTKIQAPLDNGDTTLAHS